MEIIRRHFSIIAAIAIPVVLLAVIALIVYTRQGMVQPTQDFVYASMNNTRYMYNPGSYMVDVNGKLGKFDPMLQYPPEVSKVPYQGTTTYPSLYVYDVQSDTARQISFEEASKYTLDPSYRSVDGYEIQSGNNAGLIPLFGGEDYRNRYIVKDGTGKRLDLPQTSEYFDFQFIGWIK